MANNKCQNKQNISIVHKITEFFSTVVNPSNAKWQMPKLQNKQNISIVHKITELFTTVANPPNAKCQMADVKRHKITEFMSTVEL